MANLPTPALRKKRILRDVCLLLLCPLVLLLAWGFPCFTRSQALWALQKANFFEGGRVVAWSSPPEDRDTAYAVLRRDAGTPWEPCGGRGPSGSPSGSTQFSRTTRSP